MNKKIKHMQAASVLMRKQHSGVLSTISLSITGFPFGSTTPFLMTEKGDVVIYASDIAQHSRNMKSDSRVSICVHDSKQGDSQSNARITVLAYALPDKVEPEQQQQYFALFPQAKAYEQAHDFRFYYLKTERVRYIGGFGQIYWFDKLEWAESMQLVNAKYQGAIKHMHEDHTDALCRIVNNLFNTHVLDNEIKMLNCYQQGFHVAVSAKNQLLFIDFVPFLQPISDSYDLRTAMVELTKVAKKEERHSIAEA